MVTTRYLAAESGDLSEEYVLNKLIIEQVLEYKRMDGHLLTIHIYVNG